MNPFINNDVFIILIAINLSPSVLKSNEISKTSIAQ